MFKTVIAGLTAISLTMTTATPIQAQGITEEQLGKILFGIVATAAIASLVQQNSSKPDAVTVHGPRNSDRPRHEQPRRQNTRTTLPAQCLLTHQTRYGRVQMFGQNCMRQNYRHMARLPQACAVRAVTREGPRNGWDPQCLRASGYRASGRP